MIIKKYKSPLPPPMPHYPKPKTTSSPENIFSFKKTKIPCPNPNTPIIIDTREKNSMILANLLEQKANIKQEKLEVGDYLIGNLIIERKTQTDLINSLKTNHLQIQLHNLKQYPSTLLIIENSDTHSSIHPNSINGLLLSITLYHKIPIFHTTGTKHTAQTLIQIASKNKTHHSIRPTKIPQTLEQQKQYILEGFPGIGPTKAKQLLETYPNLKTIFNSAEKELEKHLDTKTSEKFNQLLNN